MTQETIRKKGIWLTCLILLAMLIFLFDITFAVISLFFSSALEAFSSLFGKTDTSSIISSIIQIISGSIGVYSCVSLWRLQKQGMYLFLVALALSMTANYLMWGFLNYILLGIYSAWTLIVLLNMKKFR